ncbi:MAG TPA: sulfotransferase [Thermoanaerobaculia bacterium]|nr:sulfotransferase [Thermoanaerobaculia bacterium]
MPQPASHEPDPTPRSLIVLGVDRSGTSLVSELIWKWGAHAGDLTQLVQANPQNPQGFWEYTPMQDLLGELMDATGLPNCHPDMDRRLTELADDPAIRARALRLVAEMESAGKPWLWKEPYLSLCLGFWERIWRDPVYIIPVRNPYDSALSFEKMFLPPALRGGGIRIVAMFLLRWQHFMLSILEHCRGERKTLFVPYEELLQNPEEQCRRLGRFLDAECGVVGGDDERVAAMAKTVNPELWRNKSQEPFAAVAEATDEQKALFAYLRRKVDDPAEPFDPSLYKLSAGWREYLQNFDLIFDMFGQD